MEEVKNREKILNIPNLITAFRVVLTFFIVFFIFAEVNVKLIISLFIFATLTDALDGFAARRLNLKTEFGRNFDVIADRILIISTVLAILIKFSQLELFETTHHIQITIVLLREMLTIPVAVAAVIFRTGIPQVRIIGKLTTVMQAITFPLILLSVFYEFFYFSIYFSVATAIIGTFSASRYLRDICDLIREKRIKERNG